MAQHKLRNRVIAAIVYALLGGGTIYGYVRSEQLDDALEATAAKADTIAAVNARLDTLLDILAIPPDTVVLQKIVRIYVPPDTVRVIRVDTLPPITVTDTLTISLVDTLRLPVPGPIRIEVQEVHRANWTERIVIGTASFALGHGFRAILGNGKTTTIHEHHDHLVFDTVFVHDDDKDH